MAQGTAGPPQAAAPAEDGRLGPAPTGASLILWPSPADSSCQPPRCRPCCTTCLPVSPSRAPAALGRCLQLLMCQVHPLVRVQQEQSAEPVMVIGELSDDWRKEDFMDTFKKGKKENPGKHTPISLTSFPRKVMEQILLEAISNHVKKKGFCTSQLGFTQVKLCLTNLIAYDDMIASVDEGKATDVIYVVKSCVWDVIAHSLVQAGGSTGKKAALQKGPGRQIE